MKKHLSIKLFIAVIAISVYSYLVFKNGKSLNATTTTDQASLSSQAPQAASADSAETPAQN